MIKRMDEFDMMREMEQMGRGNNFTIDGLRALNEYFDEIDEDMEFDAIAICCEYTEDTLEYFASDSMYGHLLDKEEFLKDHEDDELTFDDVEGSYYSAFIDMLTENGTLLWVDSYSNFPTGDTRIIISDF